MIVGKFTYTVYWSTYRPSKVNFGMSKFFVKFTGPCSSRKHVRDVICVMAAHGETRCWGYLIPIVVFRAFTKQAHKTTKYYVGALLSQSKECS